MQKTPFLLAAAVASLTLTQAIAQVPKLDIEKTCRAAQPLLGNDNTDSTSGTAGGGNLNNAADANTYRTCMQSETAAKKSAEDLWPKVSAANRQSCLKLSRIVYPSYVELMSCLQMYNPAMNVAPEPDTNIPAPPGHTQPRPQP